MSEMARVLPWAEDETELVSELQAGSDAAFDWLVTHYHAAVYNLVLGMLTDSADAADVTQEVFLKAFRGIRGFHRGSSLKTWLYRIAVREALNQRRWWWRHRQQQTSIDAETDANHPSGELEDLGATPFDQLAVREVQAVVHQALQEVPGVFRSAVILRDLEGLSYEDVAEVLDLSIGTVKSRILRGRRELRRILGPLLNHHRATAASSAIVSPAGLTRSAATPENRALHARVYAAGREASLGQPAAMRSGCGPKQRGSLRGGAR